MRMLRFFTKTAGNAAVDGLRVGGASLITYGIISAGSKYYDKPGADKGDTLKPKAPPSETSNTLNTSFTKQ